MDKQKLCECGCGAPTAIITISEPSHGRVAGEYSRFIRGHQRRNLVSLSEILTNTTPEQFCMVWLGSLTNKGYGEIRRGGKTRTVHRVVYELAHGPIEPGNVVMHTCDNPRCVNPGHLKQGSVADNVADKVSKGRQARGETQGRALLTEDQVLAICSEVTGGISRAQIARKYGVTVATVGDIATKRSWKHLWQGAHT